MGYINRAYESEDPYLKWLRESKGLAKTTVYHYYTHYKYFVEIDLTQDTIDKYLQKRKNNKVVRGFMKSYLEFLKKDREFVLMKKPTGSIKKRVIRNFTPDQIKKVSKYSYKQSLRDGLMFDIIYCGALRLDELISVKINSFDWGAWFDDTSKHCKLTVLGKGKKQRVVLINPATIIELLNKYIELKILNIEMSEENIVDTLSVIKDPLFHNLYGKRIWMQITRNSERSIGIAIRPHELRHARATELEKQGVPIRSIQHYLGHSNSQTTEIYLHVTEKASLENIQRIIE